MHIDKSLDYSIKLNEHCIFNVIYLSVYLYKRIEFLVIEFSSKYNNIISVPCSRVYFLHNSFKFQWHLLMSYHWLLVIQWQIHRAFSRQNKFTISPIKNLLGSVNWLDGVTGGIFALLLGNGYFVTKPYTCRYFHNLSRVYLYSC